MCRMIWIFAGHTYLKVFWGFFWCCGLNNFQIFKLSRALICVFFLLPTDNVFLEAFRDHGINLVVTKLTASSQPPTIQELADTVSRRLKGEPDSTSSSDWILNFILTFSTLGKNIIRQQFDMFFLIFSRQKGFDFSCNLHEMSKPIFWEKAEKILSICRLLNNSIEWWRLKCHLLKSTDDILLFSTENWVFDILLKLSSEKIFLKWRFCR